MSQPETNKIKTLRDRLEDQDLVILTRGIKIPDSNGLKRRYPAGQYLAVDLPHYAYEQGLVVHEPKDEASQEIPNVASSQETVKTTETSVTLEPSSRTKK